MTALLMLASASILLFISFIHSGKCFGNSLQKLSTLRSFFNNEVVATGNENGTESKPLTSPVLGSSLAACCFCYFLWSSCGSCFHIIVPLTRLYTRYTSKCAFKWHVRTMWLLLLDKQGIKYNGVSSYSQIISDRVVWCSVTQSGVIVTTLKWIIFL